MSIHQINHRVSMNSDVIRSDVDECRREDMPWYVRAVGFSLAMASASVMTAVGVTIFDLTINSTIVIGTVFGVAGVVAYACASASDAD